ncbi:MAG TPA: DUF192 domain-containing protein [Gemmatimonadaceae bacterium]|nr:DUF192 domain-containing protein [Gemmatimonadaceae bacterium]
MLAAIAFAAFASCGAGDSTGPAPVPAGSIRVTIGKDTVIAELVATLAEREKGLMGRTSLPDSAGMFFAFGSDQILQFWMKDTPIALSIAFMDADGKILNIEDMEPNTETVHRSAAPARYALEVRKGWFGARNILAGAKAVFTLPIGLSIDP